MLFFPNSSFTLHVSDPHGFKRIDLRDLPQRAAIVEKYRWPFTMALQAIFTLFCLLLFVGAIVHSRCVLILFSVCGLFSIIFLWLLASVYITASVALADFCFDPTPWVMHIMQDKISKDISSYYLQCTKTMGIGKPNPFERPLQVIIVFCFLLTKGLIRLALMDSDKLDKPAHAKSYVLNTSPK